MRAEVQNKPPVI